VYLNSAIPSLYLTPIPFNVLFGASFASSYAGLSGGPPNWIIFIGYTVLALAIVGAITSEDRRKYFLIVVAFVFFFFSLGPSRDPTQISLQTPYTFLYDHISILHYQRSTARYSIMMMLSLCVLASMGAHSIFEKARPKVLGLPTRKIIAAVILILLVIEYAPVVAAQPIQSYPAYKIIAADPGKFGVLELPETITLTQFYLYEQTLTGKPLVNGKISQVAQTLPEYVYSQQFLRELSNPTRALKIPQDIIVQPYNDTNLAPIILTQYEIKYILLNIPYFSSNKVYGEVYDNLFRALGPPVYQDQDTVLFELPQWTTTSSILQTVRSIPLTVFGSGWGPVTGSGRTANDSAQLFVYVSNPGSYSLTLDTVSSSICLTNLNSTLPSTCGAHDQSAQTTSYRVPLIEGKNVITFDISGGSAVVSLIELTP
jgi:hypothetical protein